MANLVKYLRSLLIFSKNKLYSIEFFLYFFISISLISTFILIICSYLLWGVLFSLIFLRPQVCHWFIYLRSLNHFEAGTQSYEKVYSSVFIVILVCCIFIFFRFLIKFLILLLIQLLSSSVLFSLHEFVYFLYILLLLKLSFIQLWSVRMQNVIIIFLYLLLFVLICGLFWRKIHGLVRSMCILQYLGEMFCR